MFSMTTDYFKDIGNPVPYLEKISEAGFSHVHWCHEWSTDHLYSDDAIEKIKKKLSDLDLKVLDIHASYGVEISWGAIDENQRRGGVELVKNRIDMADKLDSGVIIMHTPEYTDSIRRSLDELRPYAKSRNTKIAIENIINFPVVDKYFSDYSSDFLGLCYDSGHGNLEENSYEWLDKFKDRLISIHIHDNDGKKDLHQIPFSGTVEWERLAKILAESSYRKCVNLETSIHNMAMKDEQKFLDKAIGAAKKLSEMISDKVIIEN